MRKLVLLSFVIVASLQFCGAQSLDKMQWFNEPEQWEIKDKSLSMQVTPQSDYWRISHYGFTVDDAPFYYATYGGEFEVKVKITGDYKQRFDQAGLMLRINHENYIKAGIEFVDGKYNLSAVVTHKTSDWSVITLDKAIPYVWIKLSGDWTPWRSSTHSMIRNTPLCVTLGYKTISPYKSGLWPLVPTGKDLM